MAYRYRPGSFRGRLDAGPRVTPAGAGPPLPDGPTFEAWCAAGYRAESYPPHGYAEQPSPGLTAFRTQQLAHAHNLDLAALPPVPIAPSDVVEYPPADLVSSGVATLRDEFGDTTIVQPDADAADVGADPHVRTITDVDSGIEETRRGISGGGGSPHDHPRGGDPGGAEAPAGRAADAAEAGDGAAADREGDRPEAEWP